MLATFVDGKSRMHDLAFEFEHDRISTSTWASTVEK
jgi:hypothetical protein